MCGILVAVLIVPSVICTFPSFNCPKPRLGSSAFPLTCGERNWRCGRKGSVRPCKHYRACAEGESTFPGGYLSGVNGPSWSTASSGTTT